MRQLFCIACLCLVSLTLNAQSSNTPIAETKHYEFYVNYWFNMHHLLYHEAVLTTNFDSSLVDVELTAEERLALDEAVRFYAENMISQDLRAGKYMGEFRSWIIKQGPRLTNIPERFRVQMSAMNKFDAVYRRHFWSAHEAACQTIVSANIQLIQATEQAFVDRMSALARESWRAKPIPVNVTYLGKINARDLKNRSYTVFRPLNVVMNTAGDDEVEGSWVDHLYLAASRHMIQRGTNFVGGTINNVAEVNEIESPRPLWQAYLSYMSCQVTQELLTKEGIDYPYNYMERNNSHAAYSSYLEEHLTAYMNGEQTLADVTLKILQAIAEDN